MLKQASLISMSKLTEKAFSFFTVLQLTYIFNPEVIGKFFFYFSLISIFLPFMDFGLKKLYVLKARLLPVDDQKRLLGTLIILKLICGLSVISLLLLIELILNWDSPSLAAVFYCFLAVFADEVSQLFRSRDHAEQKYTIEIAAPILNKASCFIIIFAFKEQIASIENALLIYALCALMGTLLSSLSLKGKLPNFKAEDFKTQGKKLLKEGFPFSLTSLFVMISFFIDSVILGIYSLEENGIYNSAFRIIIVFGFLSSGICHVLFAKFNSGKSTPKQISKTLSYVLPLVISLFSSIAIGIVALSERGIAFLYNEEYKDAATIMILLAPFILFSAISNIFAHTLESCGQQKKVMKFNGITCSFNLIANLIFIPIGGMYAAAITTVLTEITNSALSYRELKKQGICIIHKTLFINTAIAALMILTACITYELNLLSGLIIGASVFCALFYYHLRHLNSKHKELDNAYING